MPRRRASVHKVCLHISPGIHPGNALSAWEEMIHAHPKAAGWFPAYGSLVPVHERPASASVGSLTHTVGHLVRVVTHAQTEVRRYRFTHADMSELRRDCG